MLDSVTAALGIRLPLASSTVTVTVVVATPSAVTVVGLAATVDFAAEAAAFSANTTGVLVPVLPAASVSLATMLWLPLPDSVTLALQLPSLATVAVPSGVALPLSNSVTVVPASATSTEPVMVWLAWLVAPPLLVIATTGAVVSSVKLSEAVPVLPKASVWLATMVCAPSASPLGVNDQAPCASAVTVVAMALPSMVKCTTVLASPVPLSASLEVIWPLADEPVSMVKASVTVGAVVLRVKTTALEVRMLPAASLTCAISGLLPLFSVTGTLKLPSGCTSPLPIAVGPSRMVTFAPASATSTVPVMVCAAWLVGPPVLVIATTGAAVFARITRGALVFGVCTGAGGVEFELLSLFTTVVISGLESAAI